MIKPSSDNPTEAANFVEVLKDAGIHEQSFSLLTGSCVAIGDLLMLHPKTRFIAFTGSKEVGLRIIELAAKTQPGQKWIKRVIADMGGKDAIVVDKETGQRRMPTQEEVDEVVSNLATLANRPEELPITAASGGEVVDLQGGYGGVLLARPADDGSWETLCVFTFDEGAEFLGLVEELHRFPTRPITTEAHGRERPLRPPLAFFRDRRQRRPICFARPRSTYDST